MYPARVLSEARMRNNRCPTTLPCPDGSALNKSPILVKKVEGGGVGKFRNNEGTVEELVLGTSTGFGGLRDGGVNVIIVMIRGQGVERLEVGREGHERKRGMRRKNKWRGVIIKAVITKDEP